MDVDIPGKHVSPAEPVMLHPISLRQSDDAHIHAFRFLGLHEIGPVENVPLDPGSPSADDRIAKELGFAVPQGTQLVVWLPSGLHAVIGEKGL